MSEKMAEVLAAHRVSSVRVGSHAGLDHMPDIGVYEQRCQTCGKIDGAQSDHQAAALSAAGFGPVREAKAEALEEAAAIVASEEIDQWRRAEEHSPCAQVVAQRMQVAAKIIRARAAAVRGEG